MNTAWRSEYELGKGLHIEYCSRKRRSVTAGLLAGGGSLKGIKNKIYKGRCPLCLSAEDLKHISLKCSEINTSGTGFLNGN
jgi:hypothetical protein